MKPLEIVGLLRDCLNEDPFYHPWEWNPTCEEEEEQVERETRRLEEFCAAIDAAADYIESTLVKE